MTIEDLKQRLGQIEWKDVEFKRAQRALPRDVRESVSAFSNTEGGHIVLGVEEKDGQLEIVGVLEPDKVQNDFLSQLRTGDIYSCVITSQESLIRAGDSTVLAFYIPEARRQNKPVHYGKDLRNSFIRRGAGDERCNEEELRRLLRDAAYKSFDDEILEDIPVEAFLSGDSLRWYRQEFRNRNPGHATEDLGDGEFLEYFGLFQIEKGQRRPTRACVLLFGRPTAIYRMMPRSILDFRIHASAFGSEISTDRWRFRELSEGRNIVETWRWVVQLFLDRVADRSFRMDDKAPMQRADLPLDYMGFREALLNLLIHQDYGDLTRKAQVLVYTDCTLFWNSGASYVGGEDLFKPGDKEVRNPRIRTALHRIGIGEQANSGIRAIYLNQRQLGRVPPVFDNQRAAQSFQVVIPKELLITERQESFRRALGVELSDAESVILLHALQRNGIGPLEAATVSGLSGSAVLKSLSHLVTQRLLDRQISSLGEFFLPRSVAQDAYLHYFGEQAHRPSDQPPSLVTDHADLNGLAITEKAPEILRYCATPKKLAEIMDEIGIKSRTFFRRNHLQPLIDRGFIQLTHPETPNHQDQRYHTTDSGNAMMLSLVTDLGQSTQQLGQSPTDQPEVP